ncbi:MAG: S9 family peptidase [Paludibacteraceae bacterium]|nr:S9 family peptidase [Paludibacteraceae bacterium]
MKKSTFFVCTSGLMLLFSACKPAPSIDRSEIEVTDGLMSNEVLWSLGRMGSASVSPDGEQVLYTVSYQSVEQNKSNSEIYLIQSDGQNNRRLTSTDRSEVQPQFMPDGEHITFLARTEDEGMQLFRINLDGSHERQLTHIDGGLQGYRFSPDGQMLLYIKQVKRQPSMQGKDMYDDLPETSGRVITELNYRHWDCWVDEIPHPFLARFDGKNLSDTVDLLHGQMFESPMLPWGGIEQLCFTPDSRSVLYTCRKKQDIDYVVSTNSDIYQYDIHTQQTRNLTDSLPGYDVDPLVSPDGKYMAWASMPRDGYESDKNRLMVMNLRTGEQRDMFHDFDQSVNHYVWQSDSRGLWFTSVQHGMTQIYHLDLQTDSICQLTHDTCNYDWVAPAAGGLVALRQSMTAPRDLYRVDSTTGESTPITCENQHIMSQLRLGRVEARWMPTTDGKQMLTWVVYPPDFDPSKKYPAVLYCQGGPQQPVTQSFGYYWNFQNFAANGYIIVAPNRRGLYGFGQEWLEQISGDYGGQNMQDYLTAIDLMAQEPYVDETRLGAMGASYGGFSVYWLAGHHDGRFKALIAHDGIFNLEQQYVETEEMWFVNWDLGGAPWDKQNPTAVRSYENSPHKFVDRWTAPILCIHGELDYRIVASQGMAAFNAARLRGIPAKYLYFPDENHWVLRPQNCMLWEREMIGWLDRWLKDE